MSTAASKREARLNVRLPGNLKQVIEDAAAAMGQSVSDFAVSTLVVNARRILQESSVTKLSARDSIKLLKALDNSDLKPNKALADAAKKYRKRKSSDAG